MPRRSVRKPLVTELLLLLILAGKHHAEEQFRAQLGLSPSYDNLMNRSSDGEEDKPLLPNQFSGKAEENKIWALLLMVLSARYVNPRTQLS